MADPAQTAENVLAGLSHRAKLTGAIYALVVVSAVTAALNLAYQDWRPCLYAVSTSLIALNWARERNAHDQLVRNLLQDAFLGA